MNCLRIYFGVGFLYSGEKVLNSSRKFVAIKCSCGELFHAMKMDLRPRLVVFSVSGFFCVSCLCLSASGGCELRAVAANDIGKASLDFRRVTCTLLQTRANVGAC